jgi:hypothetical protein
VGGPIAASLRSSLPLRLVERLLGGREAAGVREELAGVVLSGHPDTPTMA